MNGCLSHHENPDTQTQSTPAQMSLQEVRDKISVFDGMSEIGVRHSRNTNCYHVETLRECENRRQHAPDFFLTSGLNGAKYEGEKNNKVDEKEFVGSFEKGVEGWLESYRKVLPYAERTPNPTGSINDKYEEWTEIIEDFDANKDGALGLDDDLNCDGAIDMWDYLDGARLECALSTYTASHPHKDYPGFSPEDEAVLNQPTYFKYLP